MILVIDTAGKEVSLGLITNDKIEQISWEQGRDLSTDLYKNLDCLYKKVIQDIHNTKSIIVNAGPGSFTGLRIGVSTANAFAYSLDIPIFGIVNPTNFNDLVKRGKLELQGKEKFTKSVFPEYGAEPNITKPKK